MTIGEILAVVSSLITIFCALGVFIKVGAMIGKQEQINKNQDEKNDTFTEKFKEQDKKYDELCGNISDIRVDIREIKTVLKMTPEKGR